MLNKSAARRGTFEPDAISNILHQSIKRDMRNSRWAVDDRIRQKLLLNQSNVFLKNTLVQRTMKVFLRRKPTRSFMESIIDLVPLIL